MPWDYKTNKPDSVKYLHPKIQRKAISIANAILESGGDEGVAIATGIKKAKGLVKLAFLNNNYWKSHVARKRLNVILDAFREQDPDKFKELVLPKIVLDELGNKNGTD